MFLIVHATVGAAIGERLEPPIISFWAGFLSHFIADIIPHGDERSGRELFRPERRHLLVILAVMDGLAALSLVTMLWAGGFFSNAVGAMASAVGAIMPDALVGISEILDRKLWPAFSRFHDWNHGIINIELPLPIGGLIQAAVLLIALRFLGLIIF